MAGSDCAGGASVWRKFPYARAAAAAALPRARGLGAVGPAAAAPQLRALVGPAAPQDLLRRASVPEGLTLAADPGDVDSAALRQLLSASLAEPRGVLAYVCPPMSFCGGHGDRLFGILGTFFVALLTQRRFYLDMRAPMPLQTFLAPAAFAWAARTDLCPTRRWDPELPAAALVEEIRALPAAGGLVCVQSNRRFFAEAAEALPPGGPHLARPGLAAALFDLLFRLAPAPQAPLRRFEASVTPAGRPVLGIHFRLGNHSPWRDPPRHSLADLGAALACAAHVEQALGLANAAWLLAADSLEVRQDPQVAALARSGKLLFLEREVVHLDRSSPVPAALAEAFATWWALAFRTSALVLAHSNFGWSAAEIGGRRAYFFRTCTLADARSP